MMESWAAVVTAGGFAPPALEASTGVRTKALAKLGDSTLLDRCLASLSLAGVRQIIVVGDESVRQFLMGHAIQTCWAERGANPVRSAESGLKCVTGANRILFVPADTPFLSASHIQNFCESAERRAVSDADWLSLGICSRADVKLAMPSAPYRFVRLKEGAFATSSLNAGTPGAFHAAVNALSEISENRKSKFAVVRKVGFSNLIRLLTGTLTLRQVEMAAEKIFGCRSFLIQGTDPLASFDIDDVADWEYANRFLAKG